jgi:hypothetical protein
MDNAQAARQMDAFQGAVKDFTAQPNALGPITTMVELAMEAVSPGLRRWAGTWLKDNCGICVMHAEDEEARHAAPPEAANVR